MQKSYARELNRTLSQLDYLFYGDLKYWLIYYYPFITAIAPTLLITVVLNSMIVLQLLKRFSRTRNRTLVVAFLLMWLACLVLLGPDYIVRLKIGLEALEAGHTTTPFRQKFLPVLSNSYRFVNSVILLVCIKPFQKPFKATFCVLKKAVDKIKC